MVLRLALQVQARRIEAGVADVRVLSSELDMPCSVRFQVPEVV